ncbi:MAG: biosynthetic peptidoglycan transglycosylase [Bacteriovoracales bacterium]
MKKIILIIIGLIITTFIYQMITFPWSEVRKLSNGYVKVNPKTEYGKDDIKADYEIVSQRPKNYATFNNISSHLRRSILLAEDYTFYHHNGIDVEAMKAAIEDYMEEGGRLRGASTITQQVAKNLFLTRKRSFFRKFKEICIALYMEHYVSKSKILEIYLNIVEFGPKLYGVSNASSVYFHKGAGSLTAREAAFLSILLPNPKKYSISFQRGSLSKFTRRSVNSMLRRLYNSGHLSLESYLNELYSNFWWEKA